MKKLHIKLLLLFVIVSGSLYSQNKEEKVQPKHLVFTESKILDEHYKVVYFCFLEVRDQDHQNEIQNALSNLDYVKKIRIYLDLNQDYRCQLTTYRDVTPDDIFQTLKQVQTDFLYKLVTKEGSNNKINYLK